MKRHPRLVLLVLLVLILAVLGGRALAAQSKPPAKPAPVDVRAAAAAARELRVIVSIAARHMWVVTDSADTLLSAPVAVGSGRTLRSSGRSWYFRTPRGVRTVLAKEVDPVWVRPDWAYVEVARQLRLRIDSVAVNRPRPLPDGTQLVVRDNVVGVLRDSTFEPYPDDDEIIFGQVLYVPPIGTENRAVRGTLGKYRLNLGDGIGLHGTPDDESIGRAVTHGCLRLGDDPLEWVYEHVPVGTKVYIY